MKNNNIKLNKNDDFDIIPNVVNICCDNGYIGQIIIGNTVKIYEKRFSKREREVYEKLSPYLYKLGNHKWNYASFQDAVMLCLKAEWYLKINDYNYACPCCKEGHIHQGGIRSCLAAVYLINKESFEIDKKNGHIIETRFDISGIENYYFSEENIHRAYAALIMNFGINQKEMEDFKKYLGEYGEQYIYKEIIRK